MNVTWVMGCPSGNEEGRYLTLDMGGTNLRVCEVCLTGGKGGFEVTQDKYQMPSCLKTGTEEQLWDFVAESLDDFLKKHHRGGQTSEKIPLSFTFSYPVTQPTIRNGILQRWTKDFDVKGVEGKDVTPQLEAALERKVSLMPMQAICRGLTMYRKCRSRLSR